MQTAKPVMRLLSPRLFVLVATVFSIFQPRGLEAKESLLRNPEINCGVYFAPKSATHGHKIAELDPSEFADAVGKLKANEGELSPDARLVLVGVAPGAEHRQLTVQLKQALDKAGYRDVPVSAVRRLQEFFTEQTGLFVSDADGALEKVSDLRPVALEEAFASFDSEDFERNYLVVGMPMLGKARRDVQQVLDKQKISVSDSKSSLAAHLQTLIKHPVASLKEMAWKLRFFFPIREDWVKPTAEEMRSATQKIFVPGILTFTVLLTQSQPLEILVPVTLVNAANSFATGSFRSTIGNWIRRSKTFFPSQWLKNASVLSTFFTANLYWAGAGSVAKLKEALTLAGWQNLVTTKWLSALFSSLWRAPVQSAIFRWERERSVGKGQAENMRIRHAGSAIEKYISYVMTQFYIYSIITKNSFFQIFYSPEMGLGVGQNADSGATTLMDVNVGHLAMASVGVSAFLMMSRAHLLDKISGIALKIDAAENRFTNLAMAPLRWLKDYRKKPKVRSEDEP